MTEKNSKTKQGNQGFEIGGNQKTYRDRVSEELLSFIEAEGQNPWTKSWETFAKAPNNPISGTTYSGGNAFYLGLSMLMADISEPRFATLPQIKKEGGRVKDISESFWIEFYRFERMLKKNEVDKFFTKDFQDKVMSELSLGGKIKVDIDLPRKNDSESNEPVSVIITKLKNFKTKKPYLSFTAQDGSFTRKTTSVFSFENIEGMEDKYPLIAKERLNDWSQYDSDEIDLIISGLLDNIDYTLNSKESYSPCHVKDTKEIRMPLKEQFNDLDEYYSTIMHEYGHALVKNKDFTDGYLEDNGALYHEDVSQRAKEEVLVEMFSVLISSETGIKPTFENSSSYIKSWANSIKDDNNIFHQASRIAHKMADYAIKQMERSGDEMNNSRDLEPEFGR